MTEGVTEKVTEAEAVEEAGTEAEAVKVAGIEAGTEAETAEENDSQE